MSHDTSTVIQTAATELAVDLPSVRDQLRIDELADNAVLERKIRAATDRAQVFLRKQLITATYRTKLDAFPSGSRICLLNPPLQSVTSIQYIDTDGDTQTFSSGSYNVHTDPTPGFVELGFEKVWPTTRQQAAAVTIVYVAGYGDAESDVPDSIQDALREYVGHLYENREGDGGDMPDHIKGMLWTDRFYEVS